jgi:tetratricopeptide (TPR) repeat protein/outer membrane protein OmpA-like peptidoglycan-associated protein
MRLLKQVSYSFLLAAAAITTGCSVKTNMGNNNYTVTPNPLEVKGDSILIIMSANIPAKSFNPKANVQFQPYLKTAKGDVQLKAVTLGGEKVLESVDFKIDSKTGGKITYTEKIPYNSDLKRATLYPSFAVKVNGNYQAIEAVKGSTFADKILAEGTITTPLLVKSSETPVLDGTAYTAAFSTKSVDIYFPLDGDRFNPNFKVGKNISNKKQLALLKKSLVSNKNWTIKGIAINGFASPEGELQRNSGLSQGRTNSTFTYMKKELKKLGFTEVNDQNLTMGATMAEDWAGLTKLIEASSLKNKTALVAILNNNSLSDLDKEAQIRDNDKKSWDKIKTEMLPKLRRSELVVKGQTPLKTDAELLAMVNIDSLSDVEMLHLAIILTDDAKKMEVYNKFQVKFPNDWRGFNNAGALALTTADMAKAGNDLTRANELSPENGAVLANMGVVAKNKGNIKQAEDLYKQAEAKGVDVSYHKAIIAIKKGDYASAVSLFNKSGKKDFNTALAQLLNGDAAGAKTTIDNMAPDQLNWELYYLRAIAGARLNNAEVVTSNLTRAVQQNVVVRQMAKEDVEFIKLFGNPTFEGAIR